MTVERSILDVPLDDEIINLHIGRRLRRRRRIIGLTQAGIASAVEVKFQQVQKYECAANRISAARLFQLARALRVPVQYFFDGLLEPSENTQLGRDYEMLGASETRDLFEAYCVLPAPVREKLLALMRSLREPASA